MQSAAMQVSMAHALDDPKHVGGGSGRNKKSIVDGGGPSCRVDGPCFGGGSGRNEELETVQVDGGGRVGVIVSEFLKKKSKKKVKTKFNFRLGVQVQVSSSPSDSKFSFKFSRFLPSLPTLVRIIRANTNPLHTVRDHPSQCSSCFNADLYTDNNFHSRQQPQATNCSGSSFAVTEHTISSTNFYSITASTLSQCSKRCINADIFTDNNFHSRQQSPSNCSKYRLISIP